MSGLYQYVLGVITTAFVCAVLSAITENCSAKRIMRFLSGLVITLNVLMPLKQVHFDVFPSLKVNYTETSHHWVSDGLEMVQISKAQFIKGKVESYILDKAQKLNADIAVEIDLDMDLIPIGVTLRGEVSPYAKGQLSEVLNTELGITKENQIWTG